MYQPGHFRQDDKAALHALIRARPLASLIHAGGDGLDADHIPFVLDPDPPPCGRLRGHVARANPLWQQADAAVLAIFHGPAHYVSPAWYPSKQEHGRVVPTWNYVVVHAHGRLRGVDDAHWLLAQVEALTQQQESRSARPWQLADAPADYRERMLAAIVGIEIVIDRLVGKWKTSQNQSAANRAGVAAALDGEGHPDAAAMAALIRAAAT